MANNPPRTAQQFVRVFMSFGSQVLSGQHLRGKVLLRAGGLHAASLAAAMGLAACSGGEKAEEAALDPQAPTYASPWDRPLGMKAGDVPVSTGNATPPRNRTLAELMQLGNADAPEAATASAMEVPDGAFVQPELLASNARDSGRKLAVAARTDWTIVIVGFDKEREAPLAAEALARVRGEGGLKDAVLEERGKAAVVAYGKYPSPDAAAAKADLERIRNLRIGNERPFGSAMMAPPIFEALPGTLPQYDLRNVKAQYGDRGAYTLQVGVYCRMDDAEPSAKELGEFRAAAEKAVVEMRRQGENAFYYHGPRRSMVTVGLFGLKEFDLKNPGLQSPAIAQAMRKYPYNLVNGAGVKRKRPGQTEPTIDPSFIVSVP